jgi:hypothetical protein
MRTFGIKIVALICILSTQAKGELISTNLVNGDAGSNGSYHFRSGVTKTLSIPAGKQLVIHGINLSSTATTSSPAFVRTPVSTGQNINIATIAYNSQLNIYWNGPILGPMNIEYGLSTATGYNTFEPTLCTFLFEIKDSTLEASTATTANISSASVVVPSNAVGDVDVLLEQSNDMITWTQCLPGTYNASTQKRFFRVRAVEK